MARKKDEIIKAGKELFLKQGITNTTMEQIADAVPVSKMTIYKHFESKEGLIESIITSLIEESYREFSTIVEQAKSPVNALVELINYKGMADITDEFIMDVIGNYPEQAKRIVEFKKTIMEEFERIIFNGQKQGQIRKEIAPRVLGLYLQSMNYFLTNPALYEGVGSVKTISDQMMQLIYYGILGPNHKGKI